MADPKQSSNKAKASRYLKELSKLEGLVFWCEYVKSHGESPIESHWVNLQDSITNMPPDETIKLFFSLMMHYFENNMQSKKWIPHSVEDMVFTSLMAISKKDHANYIVIMNKLSKFIQNSSDKPFYDSIVYFSERLTQNYYEAQLQEIDISSAYLLFKQFGEA